MNLKKISITYIILIFVFGFNKIFSQEELAKEIIDEFSIVIKNYNTISMDFQHSFKNDNVKINEETYGSLEISGDSFRLDMPQQLIVNNIQTHWIYLKEMNELTIIKNDPDDEDILNPIRMIIMNKDNYKYAYIEAKIINDERSHIIELYPKESNPIMKIRVYISALEKNLKIMEIFDKNGGIFSYTIKKFRTNIKLQPFNFDQSKYTELDINDLR
jgi:outer membrane lipoprotein-sorting protein